MIENIVYHHSYLDIVRGANDFQEGVALAVSFKATSNHVATHFLLAAFGCYLACGPKHQEHLALNLERHPSKKQLSRGGAIFVVLEVAEQANLPNLWLCHQTHANVKYQTTIKHHNEAGPLHEWLITWYRISLLRL